MLISTLHHTNPIINRIVEQRGDMLPLPHERTMSQRAYTRIVIDATKQCIKGLYREGMELEDIQEATKKEGGNFYKSCEEIDGKK